MTFHRLPHALAGWALVIALCVPALAANPHGGAAGEASTNPLEFKTDLALWTAVVFLVLLWILWKCAWGPISDGLRKREQGIANQIAEAQRSNQEAKDLLAQYEERLAAAGQEVRQLIEQGRRDAEKAGDEMIDKARAEAKLQQDRAVREIEAATAGALKELADKSAAMAVTLAGKIVGAELRARDHTRLVQEAVADFTTYASGGNGKH